MDGHESVVLTRSIAGAPADVFQAFTSSKDLSRWFAPTYELIPQVECIAVPGGTYRCRMHHQDGDVFRVLACIFHHGGEFFDFSGSGSLTGDCVAKIPTLAPSDSMSAEVGAVLVALRGAWRLILPSVGAARAFVSHRHMMASVIQSNTAACLASMQAWDKPRVREALA